MSTSSPSAWRRPPSEDRHLHHGVRLPHPPAPHLHPTLHLAADPLQPPRHPQKPGGGAVLLRAGVSAGHQPD